MQHHLIQNGFGRRCQRCGISWDQGETIDEICQSEQPDLMSPVEHQSITGNLHATAAVDLPGARPTSGYMTVPTVDSPLVSPHSAGVFEKPSNAFQHQVAGTHYRGLVIQPVTFAMINRLDFCSASTVKYLTRWRDKNGKEDLLKARHFIELREATFVETAVARPLIRPVMSMANYCERNGIADDTTKALLMLEAYYSNQADAEVVKARINHLINSL